MFTEESAYVLLTHIKPIVLMATHSLEITLKSEKQGVIALLAIWNDKGKIGF